MHSLTTDSMTLMRSSSDPLSYLCRALWIPILSSIGISSACTILFKKFTLNDELLNIINNESLCSSRTATEKDLFECDKPSFDNKYNDSLIEKNQKHYGPRKRIKP